MADRVAPMTRPFLFNQLRLDARIVDGAASDDPPHLAGCVDAMNAMKVRPPGDRDGWAKASLESAERQVEYMEGWLAGVRKAIERPPWTDEECGPPTTAEYFAEWNRAMRACAKAAIAGIYAAPTCPICKCAIVGAFPDDSGPCPDCSPDD